MEIRYSKDVDPAKLNGHRKAYEASLKAAPLVIVEAYRMAKAYGTDLVFDHNGRVAYVSPNKYSLEEIRSGAWKNDPSIYEPHDSLPTQ
jgi:hypothetical protein